MNDTTRTQEIEVPSMDTLMRRYAALDAEGKDTACIVFGDVLAALGSVDGGGIMFIDPHGVGEMNVHLLGDQRATPHMLEAVPRLYRKLFQAPEGTNAH